MTVREIPVAPSRDRPAQFSQEMDAMLGSLPALVQDLNALEGELRAIAGGLPSQDANPAITAATNWNSFVTTGLFRVESASAFTGTGAPAAAYRYGILLVIKSGAGLAQIYVSHQGNELWYRGGWNGGGWTAWVDTSGRVVGPTGVWLKDAAGFERVFYEAVAGAFTATYYKGGGATPHQWWDSVGTALMRLSSAGELTLPLSALPSSDSSKSAATTQWVQSLFNGANQSKTASGFQKLPGGLILQWGISTVSFGSTVTLPIAWPTGGLVSGSSDGGSGCHSCATELVGLTQIRLWARVPTSGGAESPSTGHKWWAIGY